MGLFLSRSASRPSEIRKKRDKRQLIWEAGPHLIEDEDGYEESHDEPLYTHHQWQNMLDQKQTKYKHADSSEVITADATISLWPLHTHHTFHQAKPRPKIVAHSRSTFDHRQHLPGTTANTFDDSTTIDEVFPSGKTHFAPNYRQNRTVPMKTLAGTQSWNETSHVSQPTMKTVHLSNEPSTHRSIFVIPIAIGSPVLKMKAIYVAIDHNATFAERRLPEAHHRQHREHHIRQSRSQHQLNKTHRNRHHIDLSSARNVPANDSIDMCAAKSSSTHRSTPTPQSIPNEAQTSSSKMAKHRPERSSPHLRHSSSTGSKEAPSQSQTRTRTSDRQRSTTPVMRLSLPRPDRPRTKQSVPQTMTSTKDNRTRSHLQTALS